MPKTRIGDLEIAYETHGDPTGEPTLLIMGLGAQLILWDEAFVDELVRRGRYVIRFDNRDVGESSHLNHMPVPPMMEAIMAVMAGQPLAPPYTLGDMARDAVGLLDALGIQSAHVVGASMGGMIAQILAIEHPTRVRSLTSIMSTTNDRHLPQSRPEAMQGLLTLFGGGGTPSLEQAVAAYRSIAGTGYPFDEERLGARMMQSAMRGFSPGGVARQMLAILTTPGRGEALRSLRVPTLVIHGADDPLVPPAAGQATAEAVPGAKLLMMPGMGHDLPPALFATLATAIAEHGTPPA